MIFLITEVRIAKKFKVDALSFLVDFILWVSLCWASFDVTQSDIVLAYFDSFFNPKMLDSSSFQSLSFIAKQYRFDNSLPPNKFPGNPLISLE